MKIQLIIYFMLVSFVGIAQTFEGTITWSLTTDFTDPAMKSRMNEAVDPEEMEEMKEQMNSPEFKAMMESNPQMKAQMEKMMKLSQGGANSMMPTGYSIKMKNGNVLTTMQGGMMADHETLYLKDKNQTYLLNTTAKTYTIASNSGDETHKMGGEVKITKTTEKQKILNYTCTKTVVTVTERGKSISQIFWTTTEIKDIDYKGLSKQRIGQGSQSMYYESMEGVPLKIEMVSPEAKITMQVTEIKKGVLPGSAFQIPAGFTEAK